ncbi:hypothetical protein KVR01_007496 [Diaporthe batatas]|uniref:uncharacterized protein n=1 Tax=Diaporthe batatas TaxID=748121 RepID=UPI001D05405A|nr:uncharacterized protein KVR01_007496 [Diaporthe batatas]KAG8163018.1 hypothetical protein KVR01_007496 [Diaporthe batatas]
MKTPVTAILLLQLGGLAAAQVTTPGAELQSEELDSNNTVSIAARSEQEKNWHGSGPVVCGIYANAKPKKIRDFAYDLDNKDYNKERTIGAGQCNRVKCWDTSALYVCNDNPDAITLKGKQIGMATLWLRNHCCLASPKIKATDDQLNGQQFTPWGWNVNAAYGNCNDPPSIRPHMAGGHGVNPGKCWYHKEDSVDF